MGPHACTLYFDHFVQAYDTKNRSLNDPNYFSNLSCVKFSAGYFFQVGLSFMMMLTLQRYLMIKHFMVIQLHTDTAMGPINK